jgi:hypothetical protein
MTRDDIIRMAREAGWAVHAYNSEIVERFFKLAYEAGTAAERERIIAANAPEIERINAHIKELEQARAEERTRACRIVTGLCISDNNAREICQAIKAEEPDDGNPSF